MTESEIRKQTYRAFKKLHIPYVSTSDNRPSRNTVGCPDIFVWVGHWVGLDAKVPGGKVSKEQQEHVDQARIYIFHSAEEAVDLVISFRRIYRKMKKELPAPRTIPEPAKEFLRPGTRSIPVKGVAKA